MNINNEFLEEFKKLDKLLSDAYGEIHGVTAYLNEMKKSGINMCDDFERLKTLRNVRNKLVHEVGYESVARVTKSDITCLKGFYQRFLNGEDPLAQLHKKTQKKYRKESDNNTNWVFVSLIILIILLFSVVMGMLINSQL